MIEIKGVEKK